MAHRRLPPSAVVMSTALALVAALLVMSLLDRGGGSSAADQGSESGVDLRPSTGKPPASVRDVTLGSLQGGAPRKLGELIGSKPVVINFFGSWCAPCIREMPAFEKVHEALGDRVTFVGMAYRDTPKNARATVRKTGVTYPTFADADEGALTYFGGIEMPTTVFIDPAGKVVDVNNGPLSERALRSKLRDLYGIAA